MSFPRNMLTTSILAIVALPTFAAETQERSTELQAMPALATIQIQAHPLDDEDAFVTPVNVVNKDQLSQGASTLGEALKDELGVNSDTFGAGASRPVIRGQTAPRVKVLSDGADISDASQISPDHAITVDPLLSSKVEVLRGPSTLLYGGGAIGGVVNVLDDKIPTQLPENGFSGELNLRGNTGTNEKAGAASVTAAVGDHLAVHVEGLKSDADDYQVPEWQQRRVSGTYSESENGSLGLSWITDNGYTGISYSKLRNEYGLAGDADAYSICQPNTTITGLDCDGEPEEEGEGHLHHGDDVSWVKMDSDRVDLRSEYQDPFAGFSKINFRGSYTDYKHSEIEDGEAKTTFKNQASNARLELTHNPIVGFTGVIGAQYARSDFQAIGEEAFLPETVTDNYAVFLLENYQWNDVGFEFGVRNEWQNIDPSRHGVKFSQKSSDLSAISASASANWEFTPDYYLGLSLSHAERLPTAQELYAFGPHLATSTYEIGDTNLKAEKSNNVELSLKKTVGDLNFALNLYHNDVDGYIFADTLDSKELDGNTPFRLIQYTQKDATFDGAEGRVSYQFNSMYKGTLFGDYVRAKLKHDGDLPRIPSARAGVRFDANFQDGVHGGIEYVHGFKQNHVANFENVTEGYNLVNLDISYDQDLNDRLSYQLYLRANNLFDETYYNATSYLSTIPQQGRNFTTGIRFKF